jgi:hypothetical protein
VESPLDRLIYLLIGFCVFFAASLYNYLGSGVADGAIKGIRAIWFALNVSIAMSIVRF